MRSKPWVLLVVLAALAAGGCIRQQMRGTPVKGTDRKLSTFAFIEEGDILTLIVDTKATRDRGEAAYIPLEIAVANRGLKRLRLSRELFTLVDAEGKRYPMAGPRELFDRYPFLELDRQLRELEGIVFNKFGAMTRYPSNFAPSLDVEFSESGVVKDTVVLPRHGYLIDVIYFPTPPGGVSGKTFELQMESPDLEEPAFVKFEVL
jgi:hypothetical protein